MLPTSVPALISLAKAIYAAMNGNASFPDAQALLRAGPRRGESRPSVSCAVATVKNSTVTRC
jgi:hypothetical protein